MRYAAEGDHRACAVVGAHAVSDQRDDPENIVGVLRRGARAHADGTGSLKGLDIMSPAAGLVCADTTTLGEQLSAFREQRRAFAFCRGRVASSKDHVTLEDILECSGRCRGTQHADAGTSGRRWTDPSMLDGQMPIRELNRQLHWSLPDQSAATSAGLSSTKRVIPDVGQVFSFYGFKFEILRPAQQIGRSSCRLRPSRKCWTTRAARGAAPQFARDRPQFRPSHGSASWPCDQTTTSSLWVEALPVLLRPRLPPRASLRSGAQIENKPRRAGAYDQDLVKEAAEEFDIPTHLTRKIRDCRTPRAERQQLDIARPIYFL